MMAKHWQLCGFQGIHTSIAKKPYIFVIFQGVQNPCPTPPPLSGSAHVPPFRTTVICSLICLSTLEAYIANNMNPDQTNPLYIMTKACQKRGRPIYRQQPSTTDNNWQQTDNKPTTNWQLPTTSFLKRYFQIKRDFYASLPLKRLNKG